ncbi:MAG: Asp-tRNA(Asn)/Glu-tRNA(Gln) amidotransferase subunit GatC [Gemmatimonadales bacterium]|nr:Asp-tRNA(Asn)/Glu-tRNA(Gln) amidotransferase subunit GatC [Gemmatimonadales bacterium]
MSIGRDEVLKVADLAALRVDEADVPRLVEQIQSIVAFVDQLRAVADAGAPAAFVAGPAQAALRADVVAPDPLHAPPADFAPGFTAGFFTVPRHGAMEDA